VVPWISICRAAAVWPRRIRAFLSTLVCAGEAPLMEGAEMIASADP